MAIFASTTTSGYSDPLKALSIKALEQRQKELIAAQAQQPGITPENTQTPLQGLAHVANAAVDAMRSRRVDEAAAAQRQALAQTMSGYDPAKGFTPQQLGVIGSANPEMLGPVLTQLAEDRRAKAQQEFDLRKQSEMFGHQDKSQAEKARLDQEAAVAAENRVQARPTDEPLVTLKRALDRGEITQDQFDARSKQLTAPKASEQKIINEQKMASIDAQSSLATLDEAAALLNHPKGIHAGAQAGITQSIGENVPKALQGSRYLPDPETTQNTQRYNQIMGAQALNLLTQMKGASSDKDVAINFKIANDPNATIDNKRAAIAVLKTKLAAYVQAHNEGIVEAGGTVPKLPRPGSDSAGGGGGASARSPEDAAALEWATKNADDPRAVQIKQRLGVP
jgi:hypothetical protein